MKSFDYCAAVGDYNSIEHTKCISITHCAFIRLSKATDLIRIAKHRHDYKIRVYVVDTKHPLHVVAADPIEYTIYYVRMLFKLLL